MREYTVKVNRMGVCKGVPKILQRFFYLLEDLTLFLIITDFLNIFLELPVESSLCIHND